MHIRYYKFCNFCGAKAESDLNFFMMYGGGADAEQNFLKSERTRSQKNETPSTSGTDVIN